MNNLLIIAALNISFIISLFLFRNIFLSFAISLISGYLLIRYYPKDHRINQIVNFEKIARLADTRLLLFLLISIVVFIVSETILGFNLALFISFLLFFRLARLKSGACYAFSLAILVLAAISAGLGNNDLTKFLGILVYYFLIIGLCWELAEMFLKRRKIALMQ